MDSFAHSFVPSLNKQVLSSEFVPGTGPGTGVKAVNSRDDPPALMQLTLQWTIAK